MITLHDAVGKGQ